MKTIEDYRQHADECRQLASRARTPKERDMILNMAATWEVLAKSREKMLKGARLCTIKGVISARDAPRRAR